MATANKRHLVVATFNLRSCYNLGNIARTATALGFSEVATIGTTPHFNRRDVAKTALEASQMTNHHFTTLDECCKHYKGYALWALEQGGDDINDLQVIPTKLVLFLGNERYGMSNAELTKFDHIVSITHITKPVSSLNVSNAFAIAAYTIYRLSH